MRALTVKDLRKGKKPMGKRSTILLPYIISMTPEMALTFIPETFGTKCNLDEKGKQRIGNFLITTQNITEQEN